jgi:threonine dehydrogenase-like Zn-dependent dehydrogenase
MRGAIIHAPGDVRIEDRPDPGIVEPTDAVVRTVATCVCGSDLWRYRGVSDVPRPTPIGHEYVGVVEAVGDDVRTVVPGQFVGGGFLATDNTCRLCRAGAHANCQNVRGYDGCRAEAIRIPWADRTLLALPDQPDDRMVPDLPQEHMFWKNVGLRGGPAPVRAYLPGLLARVLDGRIEPGKVFDLTLPLEKVAEAYAVLDERRATKVLLRP